MHRVLPALAVICLTSVVTTGCQFGNGHPAAHEPHYAMLEQGCFGYEPTVWRNVANECTQAVRMIPNEVVPLPPAQPTPPPAETTPSVLPLDDVPAPGDEGGLPKFMQVPDDETTTEPAVPPAETPAEPGDNPTPESDVPAVEPAVEPAKPPVNEPAVEPAVEPAKPPVSEPAVEPAQSPAPIEPEPTPMPTDASPAPPAAPADQPAPASAEPSTTDSPPPSIRSSRVPVRPVAHRVTQGSRVAAGALFQSMEQALGKPTTPEASPARENHSAVGLARFISY